MNPAHLRMQPTHQYGLETQVSSAPYGAPLGMQQLPRALGLDFGIQTPSLNPTPVTSLAEGQQPWPERVLDEVRDLLLLLTPDGRVSYVSPSCRPITGFGQAQLEQNYFSRFIHDDDKAVFAREFHECIATGRPLRCHFRVYHFDNSSSLVEARGHPHFTTRSADGSEQLTCHGVFLVCRPYHTQSTQILDSFLEHKLENIRLKERIAQLKREEEDDMNVTTQQVRLSQVPSAASYRPIPQTDKAFTQSQTVPFTLPISQDNSMLSGEENESSDTLGNVDEIDKAISQAAQADEDTSHIFGIELLTGLNYGQGERSQGISTGILQNRLFQYTGNPSSSEPDRVPSENEPRKKLKGEYRCADCGTSDSPEWRKGPDGPKTLCNACGLRWAKREKKRHDSG
ncbi:hypothetical protein BJX68DRAFT_266397 [Aspergillus pseudodeflectus]|uniref:Uncharacterized protein n=1 Tax=Aspergillus pseudodeflectus TaxID=176178 RepID=A0ABR4KEW5_9EURO